MGKSRSSPLPPRTIAVVVAIIVVVVIADLWAGRAWRPQQAIAIPAKHASAEHAHEHGAEHDHDHPGHAEATSIEISKNGLRNIDFAPSRVQLGTYERTTVLPAIVIEQAGRTQIQITAPFTGVIDQIYVATGEAVQPGSQMFKVRLTHEELVTAQKDYLQDLESMDVVDREITRLTTLGEGVIAGKRILEQQYEKQKLMASLRASEEALLLHGLSSAQVQEIRDTRRLLKYLTIYTPERPQSAATDDDLWFHVQALPVSLGQQVMAGQELCILADHSELFIEGRAFEDDALRLREAAAKGWPVSAVQVGDNGNSNVVKDLTLLYLADRIDPDTRAFRFYLRLPNTVLLDRRPTPDHRFIDWQFKPGQRMEIRIPVERWEERIVLPVDAIVDEGAESFVYRQNGGHFDRVSVHVEYRDRTSAVVDNNGALFRGDVVAGRGAYQMHLALKNKSGGGIDPHAGHNH